MTEIVERKTLTYADVTCNLNETTVPLWDDGTDYTLPTSSGAAPTQVWVPWESDMTTMLMPDHIYELQADSAAGHYPANYPSEWKDKGASNKYKAFDKFIITPARADGTEATSPGEVVYEVNCSKCNRLHLFGLDATNVTAVTFDSSETVIDTQAFSLIDSSRIVSLSTFFLEERPMLTELHITIPIRPISKVILTISDSRSGRFPGIGTCFPGLARDIGVSKKGIKTGVLDFTEIVRDKNTGEVWYNDGDSAKLMTLDVRVQESLRDYTQNLLDRLRGKPVVVSGNNPGIQYSSYVVLGLLYDWELINDNNRKSTLRLKMEGFI